MKIKAGRVNVFTAMRKTHSDMRLVGALVGRESHIAIDAKQGTARGARIGIEMRRYFVQRRCEIGNKAQCWLADRSLEFILVGQEPFAIVVALEPGEKAKEFRRKVGGHSK